MARKKIRPLAAISCTLLGTLTAVWGGMCLLDQGQGEDNYFSWGAVYLGGLAITTILGIISLCRREEGKLWTILCVLAALAPLVIGFLRWKQ